MQLPLLICEKQEGVERILDQSPQMTPGICMAAFRKPMPVPQPPTTRSARPAPPFRPLWM